MCGILYVVIHINLCVKVEEHYIRAIEIYEMSLGASDMNVVKTKNNLVRFTCGPSAMCAARFLIWHAYVSVIFSVRFYLFRLRNIISVR